MPTTGRAPPLAWGITPWQEDALRGGSMGWEEAELTNALHRPHLLGNNPPQLQPRAAKHFAASPAGTRGRWGRLPQGSLLPHSRPLPSSWGETEAGIWHARIVLNLPSFCRGAKEGPLHPGTQPCARSPPEPGRVASAPASSCSRLRGPAPILPRLPAAPTAGAGLTAMLGSLARRPRLPPGGGAWAAQPALARGHQG